MGAVTITISKEDAACLMVVLDGQADRLRAEDYEAWNRMCNVTERLVEAMK